MRVKFVLLVFLVFTFQKDYSTKETDSPEKLTKTEQPEKSTTTKENSKQQPLKEKHQNPVKSEKEEKIKKSIRLGITTLSESLVMEGENSKIIKSFQNYFLNTYTLRTGLHKLEKMESQLVDPRMEEEGVAQLRRAELKDEYIPGKLSPPFG